MSERVPNPDGDVYRFLRDSVSRARARGRAVTLSWAMAERAANEIGRLREELAQERCHGATPTTEGRDE